MCSPAMMALEQVKVSPVSLSGDRSDRSVCVICKRPMSCLLGDGVRFWRVDSVLAAWFHSHPHSPERRGTRAKSLLRAILELPLRYFSEPLGVCWAFIP